MTTAPTTSPKAGKAQSVAVVAMAFAVLVLAAFATPNARSGQTDFLSFYAGAQIVGVGDLYSMPRARAIQRSLGNPDDEVRAFIRMPFYAVLVWPLGRLPYQTAYVLWQMLNLAAVAGFLWLWSPRVEFVPLCCLYFPLWICLARGQDDSLLLCAVAGGASLLRVNRPIAAGMVFALCAIKFHLLLLLPLLFIAKRLWRVAGGFLAGASLLSVVSFLVAGWDWPLRYVALLRANEAGQASQIQMPNMNGLLHALPYSGFWLVAASAAVAYGTWHVIRRSRMDVAIGATLYGGLLVGMHGFLMDTVLLLPLFMSLSDRLGLGKTYLLSGFVGFSMVALGTNSTAWVAQLVLVALFLWVVLFAPVTMRAPQLGRTKYGPEPS